VAGGGIGSSSSISLSGWIEPLDAGGDSMPSLASFIILVAAPALFYVGRLTEEWFNERSLRKCQDELKRLCKLKEDEVKARAEKLAPVIRELQRRGY
jgi:hypothetical protein